jgi:hypothetical protein
MQSKLRTIHHLSRFRELRTNAAANQRWRLHSDQFGMASASIFRRKEKIGLE